MTSNIYSLFVSLKQDFCIWKKVKDIQFFFFAFSTTTLFIAHENSIYFFQNKKTEDWNCKGVLGQVLQLKPQLLIVICQI